jgi:hypothetical protein
MAPEARSIFGKLQELLTVSHESQMTNLQEKAARALREEKYEELSLLTGELKKGQIAGQELYSAFGIIYELFDDHPQFGSVDIPISALTQAEIEIKQNEHHVLPEQPIIKDEITSTSGSLILELLQNEKGEFLYISYDQIIEAMLPPEKRQDDQAKKTAKSRHSYAKSMISQAILEDARSQNAKNIKELLEPKISKTKEGDDYRKFYQTAVNLYGNLKPEEFVKIVMNRFRGQGKKEKTTLSTHENNLVQRVSQSPATEIVLACKLRDPENQNKLKNILNVKSIFDAAKGWKGGKNPNETLFQSFEKAQKKRDKGVSPITGQEETDTNNLIALSIKNMHLDPQKWQPLINSDYSGWKLLYALMTPLKEAGLNGDDIVDLLFPKKLRKADSSNSYLLES